MRSALLTFLCLIASAAPSTPGRAASFTGLGDLAGGWFESHAAGITSDGTVVVGTGTTGTDPFDRVGQAFIWSPDGGMVGLGHLPGGEESRANAVSADGSVVVGMGRSDSGAEPFRWSADGGMVGLGQLPGGTGDGQAMGTSADGSVVVGYSNLANPFLVNEAFRWTGPGGMVDLGSLGGSGFSSLATGTSADGSVVVGYSTAPAGYAEAFRWTSASGMVGLGNLSTGNAPSYAFATSADGSAIAGSSETDTGEQAFRWTPEGGMTGLGRLGDRRSGALAISADGAVVVGGLDGGDAFIWTEASGMRSLTRILTNDYGLDLTGWHLSGATGVASTADGITIVGNAENPAGFSEAWLATIPMVPIPEPSTALLFAIGLAAYSSRCRSA